MAISVCCPAQTPDETVYRFFEALNTASSEKMQREVDPNCSLRSLVNGSVHQTSMSEFYKVLDTKPQEVKYEEKIYSLQTLIDQEMAMVWVPYRFFVNDKFSHCGVNLFTLALQNNSWIILSILDTRRQTGCVSDE